MAVVERDLTKPERAGQGRLVAGLKLDVDQVGPAPPTLITLSAAALRVVISESITSTGPRGPIPNPSSQAAGSSQTSSFVEMSKRLKSIGQLVPPSIHEQQRIKNRPDTELGSFWGPSNFRYQPFEPGHGRI